MFSSSDVSGIDLGVPDLSDFPASSVGAKPGLRMIKIRVPTCRSVRDRHSEMQYLNASELPCSPVVTCSVHWRGKWKRRACNSETGLKRMDGISLCFLSVCSCSSHIFFYFFFLSSTDKTKLEMLKYSSKRGEVHREKSTVSRQSKWP